MSDEQEINYVQKAVTDLGGPVAAAKKLGVRSYQSVQQWISAGQVPAQYCKSIEQQTGVSCKELRPVDYFMIWPELAD